MYKNTWVLKNKEMVFVLFLGVKKYCVIQKYVTGLVWKNITNERVATQERFISEKVSYKKEREKISSSQDHQNNIISLSWCPCVRFYGVHHWMEQIQLEDNKVRKESVTMLSAIITQKIECFCPFPNTYFTLFFRSGTLGEKVKWL